MTLLRNITTALAIGIVLIASAEINLPTKVVKGKTYYYYKVPPKETIYSITRKFGFTREEIFKYNPQVIDGLRAGDTLIFPTENMPVEQPDSTSANPEFENNANLVTDEPETEPESNSEVVTDKEIVAITNNNVAVSEPEVALPDSDAVNITVILPFMLDQENITRQTQNHTNFYRGALLAVDSLASAENKINLTVFDSNGSADTVSALMKRTEVLDADYIIAPGDSLSIEIIAATADTTGATVVNLFAVKNDAHLRHESVLQINVPHDAMYAHAIKAFCNDFKNYKILILNATDIPADKQAFVNELTESLVRIGIPYEHIDYSGKLTQADLESLELRDYIFIPTSSSREGLLKVLPSLTEFTETHPTIDVRMFGYPEWVVLRGDIKEKLHRMNATVYSRFSIDLDGDDITSVNNAFTEWYGTVPSQSVPDTMLLGFDTIAWILHTAANGIDSPYTGMQNSFKITELEDAGDVNESLYFINFTRSGRVEAKTL